MSRGGC
eukprot:gene25932-biopygen17877